jgi:hypothetical protein
MPWHGVTWRAGCGGHGSASRRSRSSSTRYPSDLPRPTWNAPDAMRRIITIPRSSALDLVIAVPAVIIRHPQPL